MTLSLQGSVLKAVIHFPLITLIVLNENAYTNPNPESLLW